MLALASRIAALIATALGWALMVVIPSIAFIGLPGLLFSAPGDVSFVRSVAAASIGSGLGVYLYFWLTRRLIPSRLRVRGLFPGSKQITPGVWIAPGNALFAYAVPGFAKGAIVISEGVASLPADESHWVIAHERSHLLRGDAAATLWWRAGSLALRLAAGVAYLIYRLTRALPLLGRLGRAYYRIAHFALRLSVRLFRLLDLHIGRRMEYRADRDAAKATSAQAGARLMRRLDGPLEPGFNLFATHPPTRRRVSRLDAMVRDEGAAQ